MTEKISLRLRLFLAAGDRTKAQVTPENPENETLSVKPNYELEYNYTRTICTL